MSALSDLLMIERALGKGSRKERRDDPIKIYNRIKKLIDGKDKKKDDDKKGKWTTEDRICLGILMAFLAIPLAVMYTWVLHSLVR